MQTGGRGPVQPPQQMHAPVALPCRLSRLVRQRVVNQALIVAHRPGSFPSYKAFHASPARRQASTGVFPKGLETMRLKAIPFATLAAALDLSSAPAAMVAQEVPSR